MDNQQERLLGWLGGIIDGEGSIYFSVSKRPNKRVLVYPGVCIVNTNLLILTTVQTILRDIMKSDIRMRETWLSIVNKRAHPVIKSNRKCFQIDIRGIRSIYSFLRDIEPYLIGKKEQANLAVRFIELRFSHLVKRDHLGRVARQGYTKEEAVIVDQVRKLNGKESSETLWNASNLMGDDKGRTSARADEVTGNLN